MSIGSKRSVCHDVVPAVFICHAKSHVTTDNTASSWTVPNTPNFKGSYTPCPNKLFTAARRCGVALQQSRSRLSWNQAQHLGSTASRNMLGRQGARWWQLFWTLFLCAWQVACPLPAQRLTGQLFGVGWVLALPPRDPSAVVREAAQEGTCLVTCSEAASNQALCERPLQLALRLAWGRRWRSIPCQSRGLLKPQRQSWGKWSGHVPP